MITARNTAISGNLKAREQMKGQEEKKDSVLGAIKKYQAENKEKPKERSKQRVGIEKLFEGSIL